MSLSGMWLSWGSLAEQPGCGCLPEAARVMQHPLLGGELEADTQPGWAACPKAAAFCCAR